MHLVEQIEKKKEQAKDIYFKRGKRATPFLIEPGRGGVSKQQNARKQLKKVYMEHIEAKKTLLMDTASIPQMFRRRGYEDVEREKIERKSVKEQFRRRQEQLAEMDQGEDEGEEPLDEEEMILRELEEKKQEPAAPEQGEEDIEQEFGCLVEHEEKEAKQREENREEREGETKGETQGDTQGETYRETRGYTQGDTQGENAKKENGPGEIEGTDEEQENEMPEERRFTKLKKIRQKKQERREAREKRQKEEQERQREIDKTYGKLFYDKEAEVGSENEENDHIVKKINQGEAGENEEGLDEDYEELIDRSFDREDARYDQAAADRFHIEEMIRDSEQLFHLFNRNLEKYQREKDHLEETERDKQRRLDKIRALFEQFTKQNGNDHQGPSRTSSACGSGSAPSRKSTGFWGWTGPGPARVRRFTASSSAKPRRFWRSTGSAWAARSA